MEKVTFSSLIVALILSVLVSMYAGATLFFKDSFHFKTFINDLDIGGKTVAAAQMAVQTKGEEFVLSLYGKGADKEKLYGKDFELSYEIEEDLKKFKEEQNIFAWPITLITKDQLEITENVAYNETLLAESIDNLSYFLDEDIIEPVDAQVVFNGVDYEIQPEVEGNKLNKAAVKTTIISALENSERVISLEESQCYEVPKYTKDSKELIELRDWMNEYIKIQITYVFGDQKEVVTPEKMSEWVKINELGKAEFDEQAIRTYLRELDQKYSTLGKTRQFKSSNGNIATVSGGDYGWKLSIEDEVNAIMEALKTGQSIYRTPIATKNSCEYQNDDIGNSYVEINLTQQYLWYYNNGKLITHGSVVTGDERRGYSTPQGVYSLTYKQRNATLNGPGYSTPVSYWMPFNGGIGIHDATWRGRFGGSIYKTNGSHGCVNAPYSMAKAIFETIDKSMPIICYY